MEKIKIQNCKGQECNSVTLQGNNILVPFLVGVALGYLITKSV